MNAQTPHDQADTGEDDKPLDPAAERVRRKLVRFMAINLGVLFLALMAVVIAIVYRFVSTAPEQEAAVPAVISELPAPPPGAEISGQIALPDGARLISHSLSGAHLTLDVAVEGQRQILIYDVAQGRMIGRFTLTGIRP